MVKSCEIARNYMFMKLKLYVYELEAPNLIKT